MKRLTSQLGWAALSLVGAVSLAYVALKRGESINAVWVIRTNLAVAVDIVHTYIGDLRVQLIGPSGTAYTLKAYGTGGSTDNLSTTYTVNASSEVANGVWQLRVQDNAAADTGYINSWKLTFP